MPGTVTHRDIFEHAGYECWVDHGSEGHYHMTLPHEDFELHGFKCRAFRRRGGGGMFGMILVRQHVRQRRIESGRYVELGGRRVYCTVVELDGVKYDGVIMSDNNDDIVAGFDPVDCLLRMDDVAKALRERIDRGESVP